MVTKQFYKSLLDNPLLIKEEVLLHLEELQKRYPYSSDIQLLLTKGYHSLTSINYEQQLKNTAISIPDREALYNIIYKVKLAEKIELANEDTKQLPVVEEQVNVEEQPIVLTEKPLIIEEEEVKPLEKEIPSVNDLIKKKENNKSDKLEELILSHAIGSSYLLEDKTEKQEREQKEIEKKQLTPKKVHQNHSFYSWLTPTETNEEEEKENSKKSIDNLVEKFITTTGNEKIKRKEFFSPTNVAKLSNLESDDFITETLANIYFNQHMYEKALHAYEKLILKNPEKKTYFVSQIKKIKNLLA